MGSTSAQSTERGSSCLQRQDIALLPASCPDHPLQEPMFSLLATEILGDQHPNLGASLHRAGKSCGGTPLGIQTSA